MNKEYVMNTIDEALLTGRAGLSYFVNAVSGMEYNLGKYHKRIDLVTFERTEKAL